MKNKLISDEERIKYKQENVDFPEHHLSGRTTANALLSIALAMTTPGKKMSMVDHRDGIALAVQDPIVKSVGTILKKLELKHFKMLKDNATGGVALVYDVFEIEKEDRDGEEG